MILDVNDKVLIDIKRFMIGHQFQVLVFLAEGDIKSYMDMSGTYLEAIDDACAINGWNSVLCFKPDSERDTTLEYFGVKELPRVLILRGETFIMNVNPRTHLDRILYYIEHMEEKGK